MILYGIIFLFYAERRYVMFIEKVIHLAFYTDRMEEMIRFYTEVLEGKLVIRTRYCSYLDRDDRPVQQEIAKKDPDRIFNVYIEIAPGQAIELFPKGEDQKEHPGFNDHLGYSHFALLTDDIYAAKEKLISKGAPLYRDISKGPSGTYQCWFSDPDGNYFELMQYTEDSYQIKGHIE